ELCARATGTPGAGGAGAPRTIRPAVENSRSRSRLGSRSGVWPLQARWSGHVGALDVARGNRWAAGRCPAVAAPRNSDGPYSGGMIRRGTVAVGAVVGLAGLAYYLVVTGKLTLDTGWGRRVRPLGPLAIEVGAPASTVFDVIAAPYLGRTPRAMSGKL